MNEKSEKSMLQTVDQPVREAVHALILNAGHGALAVSEPETGQPFCSRVGLATGDHGAPIFLTSRLSHHTKAIMADGRSSLMIGKSGSGDPLAFGRVSLVGISERIADEVERAVVREQYLAAHPKAKLYVDFKDMSFWRFRAERAHYNAGFGQAYVLTADDLRFDPRSMEQAGAD